jgi:hypothetical protein
MDDSERSYGYSQDIYHGWRGAAGQLGLTHRAHGYGPYSPDQPVWERSYEYGAETGMGEVSPGDLSPEEAAIHVHDRRPRRPHRRRFGGPQTGGAARRES